MIRFISKPNLPQGRVTLLAAGERYAPLLSEPLKSLGCELLPVPDNRGVDARVAGHADLSLLPLGGNRLMLGRGLENSPIVNILTNRGFDILFTKDAQSETYPHDCGLNACLMGDTAIINPKTADSAVCEALKAHRLIPVNQGYAKCSICVAGQNIAVTSDKGAATALRANGVDTLLISPGNISLPGFDTGFIGGSAWLMSNDTLTFTGNLDSHPDKAALLSFLKSHGLRALFLTNDPIFDIGSAIPLIEEV